MTISILTLFPEIFSSYFSSSIVARAQQKKLVDMHFINIRDFATDTHKTVDDKPYGGGVGMVFRIDILHKALQCAIKKYHKKIQSKQFIQKIILLDPSGSPYSQETARILSEVDHLILICGHYEGFDNRIIKYVDDVISVGDFILTGGELPALMISDSVIRLVPGVLSKRDATEIESFSVAHHIEAPVYTRPESYKGVRVPPVLLSGNHLKINLWRKEQSDLRTKNRLKLLNNSLLK